MNNIPSLPFSEATSGSQIPFHRIFEAQSNLLLILSPELIILGASNSYLKETFTTREQIVGKAIFEVFPDNPEIEESPRQKLGVSINLVLATQKPHKIDLIRYDIPDPDNPDRFIIRYWNTVHSPVFDEQGNIISILQEPVNITEYCLAQQQLEQSKLSEHEAKADVLQQRVMLDRFLEQAPAAIALLEGPDITFRVINDAYQQLFPGRQLMGLPLFEALPELKGQPIEEIMLNVYRTGETYEGKEQLIPLARYEGQPLEDIYWNFIYQALYDGQGNINGVLIFALDVTGFVESRRQVEKSAAALQVLNQELEQRIERRTREVQNARAEAEQQKQRLERLFMNAPAAICILGGSDLVYELVNPGYQLLFPDRQLLGKPILEALPEIKDNQVYRTFRNVYETGIAHEEHELLIPFARPGDGELENRYFRYVQQARTNHNGEIDGILVFAFEVTDQVEARMAIEESAQQLRHIADALPVLISYVDSEKRYQFANNAYKDWFNLCPAQLVGRNVKEIVGEMAFQNLEQHMNTALSGQKITFEAWMPYREDFKKHIRANYVPDMRDGKVVGFYSLVNDITEEIEARSAVLKSANDAKIIAEELARTNESLRISNQQLTHTNHDLDSFIYTASHDLRAPISNIEMLMWELLRELPEEALQKPDVEIIINYMQMAIERFKKTISNLTEITKLQKDNNSEASFFNLQDLVYEVLLDLASLRKDTDAQILNKVGADFNLSFSVKNLRSVLYNLLSNAIKYRHPNRQLQVEINCHLSHGYLVITFSDNGLGLAPEQRDKLFSMFRRFHNHVEGSGVGLYMVKRIVDNAGGKIEVESTLGEGSIFKVYLPDTITNTSAK